MHPLMLMANSIYSSKNQKESNMKGFIVTVCITLTLIIFSVTVSHKLEKISLSLLEKTDNIYTSIADRDYENAERVLDRAQKEFEDKKLMLEATGNHEELLRIETALCHVEEFIKARQAGDALSMCREIEVLLKHLTGNFKLKAENIL